MPKEGSTCVCLSVMLNNSIFKMGKTYYSQTFLEKYKYINKKQR